MRIPIKVNADGPLGWLSRLKVSAASDPRCLLMGEPHVSSQRFTKAVSTFKFGRTFKTTQRERFPLSTAKLASFLGGEQVSVLDMGASDGSTSIDILRAINAKRYFICDLNPFIWFATFGGDTFFFDAEGACILRVSDFFVTYSDVEGAVPPLGKIAIKWCREGEKCPAGRSKLSLLNSEIARHYGERIEVHQHDVLNDWKGPKVDVAIAANLLNRSYFSDSDLVLSIRNLRESLVDRGVLLLIENRDKERSNAYVKIGDVLKPVWSINGGAEIDSLVQK